MNFQWAWGVLSVKATTDRGVALQMFGIPIHRLGRTRGAPPEAQVPAQKPEAEKPERAPKRKRPLLSALRRLGPLLRMARSLARTLHLRLRVTGTLGMGDPADTAFLAGLAGTLGGLPGVALDVAWEWVDEEIDLEAEGSARIWIAHLLAVATALLLVRENRTVLRAVMS